MHTARAGLMCLVVLSASACVYPATRTYYEVSSTSGRLGTSVCTYPDSRKDALTRTVGEVEMYVTTYEGNDGTVDVSLQVAAPSEGVIVNPDGIKMRHGPYA